MSGVRRVTLVLAVAASLIVLAVAAGAEKTRVRAEPTGPRLAAPDRPMTAWYCVQGTSDPEGAAEEQLYLANVDSAEARATITVFSGPDAAPQRQQMTIPGGRTVRVRVSDIAAVPEPGVLVETVGGRTAVSHRIRSDTDVAFGPCAREPLPSVSFAAGSTAKGASLTVGLFNPFPDDAIVDVEAITTDGRRSPSKLNGVVVPRHSRVTVPVSLHIPRVDTVAVEVNVRRGRAIAEQALALDGTDGRRGLAMSLGTRPGRKFFFPTATIARGREERLLVANPSERDATVTVRYALDAAAGIEPSELLVPGGSVTAVDLSVVPENTPFSMVVSSTRPVVAELIGANSSPQPADRRGVAADVGMTRGSDEWAVAPARMGRRSRDSLSVVSADGRAHRLRLINTETREVVARGVVPKAGRLLIDLDRTVKERDVALLVRATGPVVVERVGMRVGFTRSHTIPGG